MVARASTAEAVEKSYSKAFFIRAFADGNRKVASRLSESSRARVPQPHHR